MPSPWPRPEPGPNVGGLWWNVPVSIQYSPAHLARLLRLPEPTPEQAAAVREAVDSCPTLAIEIVEE